MELYQVFEKAVDIIETRGWCQGNCTTQGNKPLCAALAIRAAVYGPIVFQYLMESRETYYNAIGMFVESIEGVNEESIYEWNDAQGRAKEEVTSKLLTLAAIAKANPEYHAKRMQVSKAVEMLGTGSISIWVDFNIEEFKDVAIPLSIDYFDMPLKFVGPVAVYPTAEEAKGGSIGSAAPPREVPELAGVY